jgi:hypothetical protein
MKDNRFMFIRVLLLCVVACGVGCMNTVWAFEVAHTPASDGKVIPAPQKQSGPILQRQGVQVQTSVQHQGTDAQHSSLSAKKNQTRPAPVSASGLPYNTLQRETLPESHSIARLPLDGVKPAETSATEANAEVPPATDDNSAESENSGSAQIFLLLVALCTALAGTAVILYVISKRTPQKEEIKVISPEIKQELQPQVPMPPPHEEKHVEEVDSFVYEEPKEEDAAVELAQRFQRGQGEMQLLFSIQAHENDESLRVNLIHTSSSPKTKRNAKKLSKNFGLGKSEVELLRRLEKCGTSANQSQRML